MNNLLLRLVVLNALAAVCASGFGVRAFAAQDVMLQVVDGKIVTGIVDDGTGIGSLGTRVFRGNFFGSNLITSDPGFFGLPTGSPSLPAGAEGFPSLHDIGFDLLPMKIGSVTSNLFYWNGADLDGNGPDIADVAFVNPPTGVAWKVVDDASVTFLVTGTDELIPGGRIDRTSADTDPFDGIDTGRVHSHFALQLVGDNTPPAGVYMIAWQARSVGFETSDPFLFVHRTTGIADPVRNLAADWAVANLDSLFGPALPGDYNDDGVVDAADYTVWRNSFGMNIALPNEDASPNVVDAEDYAVWKQNYGQPDVGAASGAGGLARIAVPEPGTLVLALSTACGFALNRKRRASLTPPPAHRAPQSTPPPR